jgi:hypothetical protein
MPTPAQMRVTVKPAGGTDVVAVLQSDINQFTGTASAILGDVKKLSAPGTKTVDSNATTQAVGDGRTMIDSML